MIMSVSQAVKARETLKQIGPRDFREQFEELRAMKGLTMWQVGRQMETEEGVMGTSESYVSAGIKRVPTAGRIERFAKALGVAPEYFDIYATVAHADYVFNGDPESLTLAEIMANLYRMSPHKRQRFLDNALRITREESE
jgi:transcriptional regulator with XRE-family HTH domain